MLSQPIGEKIYEIRGRRVMLDSDLAALYGIETRVLKQAVRRNRERFPADFMFELTSEEFNLLISNMTSQNVISNRGGMRYMPFAFTEQGVAMLSSVLRSPEAIAVNIRIMRSFVAMRQALMSVASPAAEIWELRRKIEALEQTSDDNMQAVNDLSEDLGREIEMLYEAIAALSVKIPRAVHTRIPIGFKK